MTSIPANYFDGKTSRRHAVTLSVSGGMLVLAGEVERQTPLEELRVSERMKNAPRRVTFSDEAYAEVLDNAAFNELLAGTGFRDSAVVGMQQSWRYAMAACILMLAVLGLLYVYGLPAVSEAVAKALPESVQRKIGAETLELLDRGMMAESKLPQAQKRALVDRFKRLATPKEGAPQYEILFRKSKIGPNAFALPSGQIILTDEIIELAGNDDAVMGILAHELGHLHERHLMRRIIQGSAIGAAAAALFGDVSSILVSLPALVLDLKYSRDAEREADRYAVAMLKVNGISAMHLADAFEKLGEKSGEPPPYLSSHPPTAERIDAFRRAQ